MTQRPNSKRYRNIPNRHSKRPTFHVPTLPVAPFRHSLPVKMVRLDDNQYALMHVTIRIGDLLSAPRIVWNMTTDWILHLLHLDAGGRAVRVLACWFKAAMEAFEPVPSDTEWNALPPFASGKPAPYMALTNEGHMIIPQKRIVFVEKYIAHNPNSGHDALLKAAASI